MWVITVYSGRDMKMLEFETEQEAREALRNITNYNILTEVIYFNDHELVTS
ncbi:Uncharacterised protein [Bacillus freudenreichii]|nr:Uncharacterised protein [Bacillus freudenreichii]